MGYPQSNQQTQFVGYPQNQLYNPADLQYMQNAQRDFANWGSYQPWMTNANQWVQNPQMVDPEQQALGAYFRRVGTPYEQTQRQAYWEQMGGQTYGGVIPPNRNPTTMQEENPAFTPGTPWGDLNNMGISTAYGMPAWQQDYFNSQNATPGVPQTPMEQFNLANSGSTSMSNYGIPSSFNPAQDYTAQQLRTMPKCRIRGCMTPHHSKPRRPELDVSTTAERMGQSKQ
jgi:hypothetical protein